MSEGSSLCRTDTHSHKGSGATVGYYNMGHPNLGVKTPSKAQNTIKQQGKKDYSEKKDYSTPKSSPCSKEAQ